MPSSERDKRVVVSATTSSGERGRFTSADDELDIALFQMQFKVSYLFSSFQERHRFDDSTSQELLDEMIESNRHNGQPGLPHDCSLFCTSWSGKWGVISAGFSIILTGMNKMFLVDKPKGLTSARVVERIKRKFNVKAGHTGTLDPLATGLLIVLTGKFTKNASSFLKLDKAYEVNAILGIETDTFDSEGTVLRQCGTEVAREELEEVLKEFSGDIWQTPPPFSAKKIAGQKAYQLARKGVSVDMPPKKVSIFSLELREFQFPYFTLACEVSSGFYVRSLAHDIGERLGVGATVVAVRRTRIGPYHVEQAKGLEDTLGCN
jgi:tRNA pseudouridine55 synthase